MRRREFIAVVAGALSWPVAADAQQTGKMPRIGILNNGSAASRTNSPLFQGLRELGYTEGQNLAIEFRFADWQLDRLPALAAELVALKVDVIVAGCQSAFKFDPLSASNFDPFERRGLAVALASSELAGIAETWRARVV